MPAIQQGWTVNILKPFGCGGEGGKGLDWAPGVQKAGLHRHVCWTEWNKDADIVSPVEYRKATTQALGVAGSKCVFERMKTITKL